MLKKTGAIALTGGLLLTAAACGPKGPTPSVNESMTHVMEPAAQTIWDVSSRGYNDRGDGLDAAKLTAKDWTDLEAAARQMKERAQLLANAKKIVAAKPGETILGEEAAPQGATKQTYDAANAQQIQHLIDGNPKLFRDRANNLAKSMEALEKAARAKDVKTVYEVSSNLDEDCDSCHKPFWGTDESPQFPK